MLCSTVVIVASGAVIQMLVGVLIYQLYGAYVILIEREFGWCEDGHVGRVFAVPPGKAVLSARRTTGSSTATGRDRSCGSAWSASVSGSSR